jgi:hypothetical protein
MDEGLVPRVGTFFILVGIGLTLIFASSWTDGKADVGWLLASLISIIYGFWLRRRKGPAPQTARFSYLRKSRERGRQKKAERAEKKKQKKK